MGGDGEGDGDGGSDDDFIWFTSFKLLSFACSVFAFSADNLKKKKGEKL